MYRRRSLKSGRFPALVLFALCLVAPRAWALGLGDIELRSYLGQPLHARIELISRSPEELENISARLASADSFRMVGLDRLALSVPLAFTVNPEYPGAYVEVRSRDPVTDPVLQFVVEVDFANGRLLRQYTVFLDPPTVSAPVPLPAITPSPRAREPEVEVREPAPPPEPVVESRPVVAEAPVEASSPAADSLPETTADVGVTSQPEPPTAESQQEQATQAEPAEPLEAERTEPVKAELTESQEADSTESVEVDPLEPQEPSPATDLSEADEPAAEQLEPVMEEPLSEEEPVNEEPQQAAPKPDTAEMVDETEQEEIAETMPRAVARPAYQVTQQDLERYGPVRRGQTLWGIASELSAGSAVSVNQMMLAIQRYNPDAFGQGNINLLKSGAILRLPPTSEVARMSAREAMLESMRQAEDYADILAGRTPEVRPAPILADAPANEVESPDYASSSGAGDEARLELVPPVDDPGSQDAGPAAGQDGADGSQGDPNNVNDALLLSEEEQEVAAQESEYLSQRIQEMQEELGDAAPAVEVQDKGLAEMEQQLREQRTAQAEEEAVSPDTRSAPPREESRGFLSDLADYLPWLLLLPLVVVIGAVAWWLQRRSGVSDGDMPEPASAVDTPSETARAIADEAEDILRTLEPEDEQENRPQDDVKGDSREETATPVIDLEDYIGHIEREPVAGDEEETPADEESVADEALPDQEELEAEGEDEPEPDDPETKLDLARAYISMGDADAARELLNEVMRDGNEAQVAEASAMMDEI